MPCAGSGPSAPQFVGDPVEVTTGACVDVAFEFRLAGAPPFVWRRYYNSAHHRWHRALGWGHAHEYDHELRLHLDGIRYTGPAGGAVEFGGQLALGGTLASGPYTLDRVAADRYTLRSAAAADVLVFAGDPRSSRLVLVEMRTGGGAIHLRYGTHGLAGVALPDGRFIHVQTDEAGRVRALALRDHEHAARHLIGYEYDASGNVTGGRDAYGNSFSFRYDAENRMVRRTNRNGYSMLFEYDGAGRCVRAGGEDGVQSVALRYSPAERSTVVTEADHGQWRYFYDESGRVTLVLDPAGGARRYLYDDAGTRVAEVDPLGNVTRHVHDAGGALIAKVSPIGLVHAPDETAPPYRPHEVAKTPKQYEYGQLMSGPTRARMNGGTERALGATVSRLLTEPLLHEIEESRRDVFGKLLTERARSGAARHWGYDANGNMTRHRDFSGGEYQVHYASWNHRVRDIDPEGRVVEARYSAAERLTMVRDAGGTEHHYEHGPLGAVASVTRHGVLLETYEHDAAGNTVLKRDGVGRPLLRYEIGRGNLIAARHLASGDVHTFQHDAEGRLLRAAAAAGDVRFAYDEAGRRTQDLRDGRGTRTVYAGADTVTTVLDRFVIRRHDGDHDEVRVTDPTGRTHRALSVAPGVVHRELANGAREYTRFDRAGRVQTRAAYRSSVRAGAWVRSYRWSEDGDLLEARDSVSGATRWSYDRSHRLRAADLPDGTRQEFAYDPAGNLRRAPGLTGVEVHAGNRLARANGDSFQYDDRDRMARRDGPGGVWNYAYDSRGMLLRVGGDGESTWGAAYDALGRRVSKTTPAGRTQFFWRTDQLVAEVSPDGRLRIYVYWDSLALAPFMFVDYESVDSASESGSAYYVFANQLGAPLVVEDASGRPVWRCAYSAYGLAHVDPGSRIAYHLRFPGHYLDTETGLHYNRFRYYSPELGRYLQPDPEGIRGGLNLYAYTENPLVQVDVRGLNCGEHGKGAKGKPDCEDCLDADPALKALLTPTEPGAIMTPEQLRAETARRELALRGVLSNDDRGPCVSMVLDQDTGQAFPGINRDAPPPRTPTGQDPGPPYLHPLLQDKVDNPPPGGWKNQDPPASHSEIHALNNALWEREANRGTNPPGSLTDTNGLLIDNQRSKGSNKGTPMPCCPNCTHITGDVPSQAGKDPDGPRKSGSSDTAGGGGT